MLQRHRKSSGRLGDQGANRIQPIDPRDKRLPRLPQPNLGSQPIPLVLPHVRKVRDHSHAGDHIVMCCSEFRSSLANEILPLKGERVVPDNRDLFEPRQLLLKLVGKPPVQFNRQHPARALG